MLYLLDQEFLLWCYISMVLWYVCGLVMTISWKDSVGGLGTAWQKQNPVPNRLLLVDCQLTSN